MEPIPSNSPKVVRMNPGELVDLAPLGSVQITVFIMMLVAGIFQGYDNQAVAYAAPDFAKVLVARSYPDEIRTTGVGWTLTAGHVGAMVSPAIVAIPLGYGWTPAHIVLIPVIPALLSAVGILCAAPHAGADRITDPKPAV